MTEENLCRWADMYPAITQDRPPMTVAVIMAGNIPMVGFHDLLSVLITGNRIVARTSSKDNLLLRELASLLTHIDRRFGERIEFTGGTVDKFDAVIATGSDNTSRYFEYYFGKYPNLIRKTEQVLLCSLAMKMTSYQLWAMMSLHTTVWAAGV
jgi:hypothetical protein